MATPATRTQPTVPEPIAAALGLCTPPHPVRPPVRPGCTSVLNTPGECGYVTGPVGSPNHQCQEPGTDNGRCAEQRAVQDAVLSAANDLFDRL